MYARSVRNGNFGVIWYLLRMLGFPVPAPEVQPSNCDSRKSNKILRGKSVTNAQNRLIWDFGLNIRAVSIKGTIVSLTMLLKRLGLWSLLALVGVSAVSKGQEAIAEAKVATVEASKAKAMRPLTVATELVGETKITGTLVDSTALQMKTSFGEAQIPLSEIAGVRFAAGDETSTTVVMLNGDSITGATETKFLTVETEWGTAKINGSSLVSMLFVPGLQWESANGLNGKRWSLVETKPTSSLPKPNLSQGTPGLAPFSSSPIGGSAINSINVGR